MIVRSSPGLDIILCQSGVGIQDDIISIASCPGWPVRYSIYLILRRGRITK